VCGFCGVITTGVVDVEKNALEKMSAELIHRGPDMSGKWVNESGTVNLMHRRLSIHDLSDSGYQPMESGSKGSVIAFNGEIYNFKSLREELTNIYGRSIISQSDTEVLLECIEVFGIDETLNKVIGMFAFAYYDIKSNKLYLCRDRAGEKPLYYWMDNKQEAIYFSSELRSLLAGFPVDPEINETALDEYFSLSYISAPNTIVKGVSKLPPATLAVIDLNNTKLNIKHTQYWQLPTNKIQIDVEEAKEELAHLVSDSVKMQMSADVPVGAFLSGGVDSSLVVSIAQSLSSRPIHTYTVGFNDNDFNEATDAKDFARYLNTEHNELYLSSKDILDCIPEIVKSFDEPVGDVSLIPTQILAQFARQEVTVSLSGDGGDELFWGYSRYLQATNYWKKFRHVRSLVRPLSKMVGSHHLGSKFKKGIGVIGSITLADLYNRKKSHWLFNELTDVNLQDSPDDLARADFNNYLPNDVLYKVDRAAMSVGLEGRMPLLDKRIIEFAFQLPHKLKYKDGKQKFLLKEVLSDYVPHELMSRPKKGFNLPLAKWLRHDLADWAGDLIYNSKLKGYDVVPHDRVCEMFNEHLLGKSDYSYLLWDYIVMSLWVDEYIK
jgi:asparagine synthase (glutamine-hydrolysing)